MFFIAFMIGMAQTPSSAPSLLEFERPGPHAVAVYDVDWFDAQRNRAVPARIYAPADAAGAMPAIIFSHGLGNSRFGYSYLGRHWASYGFISVHPEHLGAGAEVARRGLLHLFRAGFDRRNWRNVPEDIHFVIDQLQSDDALPAPLRGRVDRSRIGVAGHSLGAYGALAVGGMRVLFPGGNVINFRDSRVRAAIPISMSENFQRGSYTEIAIPMLHVTGTLDWDVFYGTWARKRRVPYNSISRNDQYLVVIRGANHSTFSEEESRATQPAHDVVRIATIVFWNAYLRGDVRALAALQGGELENALGRMARVSVKGPPALRVGSISIRTAPLFDLAEASRGGVYRAANVLAVPTPETLVRKFLLFHEGDEFEPARLAETERNLRALAFLKSASVTAGEPHDGRVDITVSTQDAFTTEINPDFSNEGGRSVYDLEITQEDLFGTGGAVNLRIAKGRERRTNSIELLHPTIFGPYWNADALFSKNSDGNQERLAIGRPLYSYSTHFTASALGDHLLQTARIYGNGAISSEFRQQHREIALSAGVAIGSNVRRETRIIAGGDFITDIFSAFRGPAPDDRRFHFVQIGADSTQFRFVKADHVDFGLREQDFNLGGHAAIEVGRSPSNVWRLRSDDSYGYAMTPTSFILTHLTASWRAGRTNRNATWSDDTRLVARLPTEHPQTFVTRLRVDIGSDLDRDVQFFADGQNGLRAYPNFAFEGNRRVLLNLEHRFFLGRELLQLFEPGAALFFDTGEAVTSAPLRPRRLRSDIGAGLRFGVARLESAMLRFDFAYALNASPISRRGLVISFATVQAF
jgi:predicted dienelactone hydrolase